MLTRRRVTLNLQIDNSSCVTGLTLSLHSTRLLNLQWCHNSSPTPKPVDIDVQYFVMIIYYIVI